MATNPSSPDRNLYVAEVVFTNGTTRRFDYREPGQSADGTMSLRAADGTLLVLVSQNIQSIELSSL